MATATSRKAKVMDHFRQSMASTQAFQTWVGAVDALTALDSIFVDDIPKSVEAVRTAAEWESLRPYVVIRDETFAADQESAPTSGKWPITGALSAVFHANAVYDDSNWDNYLELNNPVGDIVDEMSAQVDTGGFLSFQRVAFEDGVQRAFDSELQEMGDFIFLEALFEYRSGR